MQKYIQRTLEPVIKRAVNEFPAIVLTGPRQSGKTTLLKHLFEQTHRYVSLELPDVRSAAAADPRAFLETYPPLSYSMKCTIRLTFFLISRSISTPIVTGAVNIS